MGHRLGKRGAAAHLAAGLVCAAALALELPAPAAAKWPTPPGWWFKSPVVDCILTVESGNGRYSSNLYGMLDGWRQAGGTGSASSATRAEQDYRAYRLYLWALERFGYGWAPWHPFDGCG